MRVREKRKHQKEQKASKPTLAPKEQKDEAAATTRTPPPMPSTTPTLSAAEKVAFDNRIKRKNVLALNEKVAALREYDRQPVYKHVGRMFNCSPDQIKRIVQQRDEILLAWDQRTRRSQDARTLDMKVVRFSMLGGAVYEWIRRMMYYKDFIITDALLQKMALQFKSSMGLNKFFPHQDWCDKFRKTYNIQHNDTKLLKIGYTQGYSVQLKDIVKDAMSECRPALNSNIGPNEAEDMDEYASLGGGGGTTTGSSHAADDDENIEVDIDGVQDDEDVKPTLSELDMALPQMVRLPLQTNTPPGTSRKVLLATPIAPAGSAATRAKPITMTIIPLALAQSITQRLSPQQDTLTQESVSLGHAKTQSVPQPIIDIKKEIKAEPTDPEERKDAQLKQPASPAVRIKEEVESDIEQDEPFDDDANNGRSSVTSLAEVLAANVEDEKEYIQQTRALRKRKFSQSLDAELPPVKFIELPPLPPLTKAPVAKRRQPDDNNNSGSENNSSPTQPVVISCAQARQYLKLLKVFALHKENYRLTELFTRADEVMREMGTD